MDKTPEPMVIRKIGASLYLRLPLAFIRANDLEPGDYAILERDRLKIMKKEDFALVGREPVLEPAE